VSTHETTGEDPRAFAAQLTERYDRDPACLIQVLRQVQDRFHHVPRAAADALAEALGLRRVDVDAVVGFYAFLSDTPRGEYDVLFADNIIERQHGKAEAMDYLCQRLAVAPGATRADGRVSVGDTSCTGMSDQPPALLVNGMAIPRVTRDRVDVIADLIERRVPVKEWPEALFRVEDNIRRPGPLLDHDMALGAALHSLKHKGRDAILVEMMGSGLRGLGGAGFKTAQKWTLAMDTPADERFVVCNADEGEPGTFKDRVLLQTYPDLVFEGMTLCARVIGARKGFLYLRGEYQYLLPQLEGDLRCRRESNLLGRNILGVPGWDFDIAIHLGAGAYVCGEESALIESLEGKRGVPRIRPPFPVVRGAFGKPTVVNNVETFVAATKIAVLGGDCTAVVGTRQSKGTKLLSVSGDVERPGIYEYPWGARVQQVLDDCGARAPRAVQIAGPAGHLIPAEQFYRQIAFEDLATGGSFMVFGQDRDLVEVVRNFAHFFRHESCGFCTPCRVGTALMRDLVDKLAAGHATRLDADEMLNLGLLMRDTSHCGLGTTAANPVLDLIDKFPELLASRLASAEFEPSFDLDAALAEARALTGRDDAQAHL
jgi:[NiFe] hydrogenase diaphorase moiety large subunit